ncbi:AraC family transcriptional regulator [Roseibium sp. AS2]|uniref:AraC family transcriptional regulator n=1 Tax=Roseibium sp. AS2 TaxID=3135781 RepID=UPI003181F699
MLADIQSKRLVTDTGSISQIITDRRHAAVIRVIRYLHSNLKMELNLETLAEIACCSRCHLVRIFANQTGVTPMNYLSSLRIQAAKSVLLQTDEKVINIAYDVGYSSLGSFGRRFAELVGLSPRALRKGARLFDSREFRDILSTYAEMSAAAPVPDALSGTIRSDDGMQPPGFAFIGIFKGNQPSGMPVSCTIARYPGTFHLPRPRPWRGEDKLTFLAAGIPCTGDPKSILLSRNLLLARKAYTADAPLRSNAITLRKQSESEPPVLLALPLLLQGRPASRSSQSASVMAAE